MLNIIIGTRAQLIKLAPVIRELDRYSHSYRLWFTGQHQVTMHELLREFEIRTPPFLLYDGPEVKSIRKVLPWAVKALAGARRTVGVISSSDVFVVHGDTFSTLLGIRLASLAGAKVAHVESGLRSFNILNPFPEEIVRLLAMRWSDVAFAPGTWAAENIADAHIEIVDTGANTLLDTLRFALSKEDKPGEACTAGVVFSIHRFETLYSRRRVHLVIDFMRMLAQKAPVTFVLHPSTEARLRSLGVLGRVEASDNVTLLPRMTYLPFIRLVKHARLVVTDGGSNQEELSYLNVPTILMRKATERREGLDSNVLIGNFDLQRMADFALSKLGEDKRQQGLLPDIYPSAQIARKLIDMDQSPRGGL